MMNKFDKIEQQRRAAVFEQSQLKMGATKPVLPPIVLKGSGLKDMRGRELKAGDRVARTWSDSGHIGLAVIDRIELGGKVYLRAYDNTIGYGKVQLIKHPERLLIINELP